MLAQIDSVVLKVDSNVAQIVEKFSYSYAKVSRVGNNPSFQSIQKYEQEISFSGFFMLKKMDELESLKRVAEAKKPVWFVQKDSHFEVIITELNVTKSLFLKGGEYMKQGFDISLKRYFE